MARGLKTGGRKKGVRNKATAEKAASVAASGVTPLDYMLDVMRQPEPVKDEDEDGALFVARYIGWRDRAFEAAKASAPYIHARLAAIEHTGKNGGAIEFRQVERKIVRAT